MATDAAAVQRLPPDFERRIERRAAAVVDSQPIPGLAVGVVVGDSLVYAGGFGLADREAGAGVTPRTLFQIGSVTKSLTAALAGILRDRGALDWDDRITRHLWEPDVVPDTAITVRHLLTHAAGLPGDPPTLRREHDDYPILAFTHFELYRSLAATEQALRQIFRSVFTVQLGLDLVWDVFVTSGAILLATAMIGRSRAATAFGVAGIGVAGLTLVLNLWTLPVPPAEAGLFDAGPYTGGWFLLVSVWVLFFGGLEGRAGAAPEA